MKILMKVKIKSCPFCNAEVKERVKNLTYQIEHKEDCFILEILDYLKMDTDEKVQILQMYELEKWNKRSART